jgi:hypothetical protein
MVRRIPNAPRAHDLLPISASFYAHPEGTQGRDEWRFEMTATAGAKPGLSHDDAQRGWLREQINLDNRYGKIGISAVAAALRYSDVTKNPADTPKAAPQIDERFQEIAA